MAAGVKLYCAAMGDQIVTWWSQQDTEVRGKISFSSHSSSRTGNVIKMKQAWKVSHGIIVMVNDGDVIRGFDPCRPFVQFELCDQNSSLFWFFSWTLYPWLGHEEGATGCTQQRQGTPQTASPAQCKAPMWAFGGSVSRWLPQNL